MTKWFSHLSNDGEFIFYLKQHFREATCRLILKIKEVIIEKKNYSLWKMFICKNMFADKRTYVINKQIATYIFRSLRINNKNVTR